MKHEMKILVTGAGGFIGGWLIEALYLNGFGNVRAGIRRWSSGARIGRSPIEMVLCDVLDKNQVEQAVLGVDAVVHCAIGSRDVNIGGTEVMLAASQKCGVKRFIHLSTVDVYGNIEGEVDEAFPFQYTGNNYGDSKIEAEKLCQGYVNRGVPVVVLRPSIVYGPYCQLWIAKFADRLKSGHWGIFEGFGEGTCNLVYIQDLIRAVFLSLESEQAVGHAFNINGSDMITWNEYFRRLNAALGLPKLREIGLGRSKMRSVLTRPLRSTARYVLNHYGETATEVYRRFDAAKKVMEQTEELLKTTPSIAELKKLSRKVHYDISKAKSILGYEPRFSVSLGLEMSARWLVHESLFSSTNSTIGDSRGL
jgi:nucleoside-diphosphate-sugar epimerase